MTTETKSGRSEISASIVSGLGFTFDLYREMIGFFRLLSDLLQASELDIGKPINRNFMLPRLKSERGLEYRLMKTEMGLMAELSSATEAEDEEEEDDGDDELESEEQPRRKRKYFQVAADTQFVAVRALLFDPKQVGQKGFTPTVTAAVLSSFQQTYVLKKKHPKSSAGPSKPDEFKIRPAYLPRLVRTLSPDLKVGQRTACKIPTYQLSAEIAGLVHRDLAQFDSEGTVEAFIGELAQTQA